MDPITRLSALGAAGGGIDLNPLGIDPGDSLEGGYFVGYISHTANSVPTHALIIAPKSSEVNRPLYGSTYVDYGARSFYDGASNTALLIGGSDVSQAGSYCDGYSNGGFTDWYLGAPYEMEIAYYTLKPTTTTNNTYFGANPYAVPPRGGSYTASDPSQTAVALFQSGGSEAFSTLNYWTSRDYSTTSANRYIFDDGSLYTAVKGNNWLVRPMRKKTL